MSFEILNPSNKKVGSVTYKNDCEVTSPFFTSSSWVKRVKDRPLATPKVLSYHRYHPVGLPLPFEDVSQGTRTWDPTERSTHPSRTYGPSRDPSRFVRCESPFHHRSPEEYDPDLRMISSFGSNVSLMLGRRQICPPKILMWLDVRLDTRRLTLSWVAEVPNRTNPFTPNWSTLFRS